jgi:alcohol dehydrogenase
MDSNNHYRYCMPRLTLFGWGCIQKLGEELQNLKTPKCLLVTDKFMISSGMSQKIIDILKEKNIDTVVFDGVKPDPEMEQIKMGVERYLSQKCTGLISLGGGSPHDCAKGIKLTLINGNLVNNVVPLVCVTTTAGTGSEITRFSVITKKSENKKMALVDDILMPDIAVDDPELMAGMPPQLTAATGMDAMAHAIEAFVARGKSPLTDCTALQAAKLIYKYLPRAFHNGADREARDGMAHAQYLAGMAFSNAGLGLVHAAAHPLGGLYHIPHGVACAVMLPYVIAVNMESSVSLYAELAWTLKIAAPFLPEKQAVRLLIAYLQNLNRELGLPDNLHQLNVKPADFDRLAEMSLADNTLASNPQSVAADRIREVYQAAYDGRI